MPVISNSYYYLFENEIKYLCVTEGMPINKAFDYLYEVKRQFDGEYSRNDIEEANAYQMLKFESNIIQISNMFEEGRDTLLKPNFTKNKIDLNSVHEDHIERFIVGFEELKKVMAARKIIFNRKEFRLSVR